MTFEQLAYFLDGYLKDKTCLAQHQTAEIKGKIQKALCGAVNYNPVIGVSPSNPFPPLDITCDLFSPTQHLEGEPEHTYIGAEYNQCVS